ncbi:hypothetical protein CA13_50690 [Planctomycetes bacterium CA13]|uniref:Methanolan biosynthesis EpsI domain-containing protein n=1 Tax=Novipirellula herctigrandis TaxID=2527986 RepID=A0A5C5Z8H6_9BACT|nr:hypothetical protein CA13_50690 [Planctomycetes bacterium CA13]
MTTCTPTRFHVVLLGCSLAVASCLVMPASRSEVAQQCSFDLPETLGSWRQLEQLKLQESELKILHASDHWQRVYQRCDTKEIMVVTLIAGPSGRLASHQPEVCYARNEFCSHSDAVRWTVPGRDDKFRFQTLEPRQIERPAMTIAYAWHDGDCWRAPRVPKIQLARYPALQRLQISMRHPSGMARDAQNAMQRFVQLTVDITDELHLRTTSLPTPIPTSR